MRTKRISVLQKYKNGSKADIWGGSNVRYLYRFTKSTKFIIIHTCHKLWTKICEIRQNFKGDLTKFCEIFLNIPLELPKYSLKSFFSCKKLVKTTTVCDLCLFLHKICCKMVWKFCEIRIFYGNCLPYGPNSVRFRFYLTVWGMACTICMIILCDLEMMKVWWCIVILDPW